MCRNIWAIGREKRERKTHGKLEKYALYKFSGDFKCCAGTGGAREGENKARTKLKSLFFISKRGQD